jgi:hypothetical protein
MANRLKVTLSDPSKIIKGFAEKSKGLVTYWKKMYVKWSKVKKKSSVE